MSEEKHAEILRLLGYLSSPEAVQAWEQKTRAKLAEYNLTFQDHVSYEELTQENLDELIRKHTTK